jgi:hypothetical protein
MMTIVTHVHLKEGAGNEWDAAMRTRLSAAKQRPGWVGGQLLQQADKPDRRVIVAPRSDLRRDAPTARRVGERTSRALVARGCA